MSEDEFKSGMLLWRKTEPYDPRLCGVDRLTIPAVIADFLGVSYACLMHDIEFDRNRVGAQEKPFVQVSKEFWKNLWRNNRNPLGWVASPILFSIGTSVGYFIWRRAGEKYNRY